MKRKRNYSWIITASLCLLAALCLLSVVLGSNQASVAFPLPQTFSGEYSWDGEHWYPLDEEAHLSALDGDLILRGRFQYEIAQGGRLNYYRDHIGGSFYLNGTLLFKDAISDFAERGLAILPSMCGREWAYFLPPDITPEDEVEIILHNPHAHGNEGAYRDFLRTLCNTGDTSYALETHLKPWIIPFQIAGVVLIALALVLLGAAMMSGILRVASSGSFWRYGLLSLFAGGFVALDTVGLSFWSRLVVFNTYATQLCMMLAVYCMGLCLCASLTGKRKKTAQAAMLLSALLDSVLILLSFIGTMVIYDTGIYWAASQLILCPVLILCAAMEIPGAERKRRAVVFSGIPAMAAVLLDLAEIGGSICSHGTCTKVVLAVLYVLYLAGAVKSIVMNHQASIRAKKLERELEDSRIATMLSQIQPHFIYNTLGTIEQLCLEQPEAASKLVHDFSLYLRGNFSELDNTVPISLAREIEHTRHYVDIEHVRFPDMEVRFQLETTDFLLPALSVQPLVENAIKHGLMGRERGGTVIVSSYETDKAYCVSVVDDGVGFDPAGEPDGTNRIGLRSIRARLEAMCGGTLTVESAPGRGTRAVIAIPKEGRSAL